MAVGASWTLAVQKGDSRGVFRGRRQRADGMALSIVDEYGTSIELVQGLIQRPPRVCEIFSIFHKADLSPMGTD